MKNFYTLGQSAITEIMIKKSRFIASVAPVASEEQGVNFVKKVRDKHNNATHNVFAYVINEQVQRFSDDGEPSGTAGKPIMEVINRKGLVQTAVVVTRYYGGILLGAGGLVRAYSESAVAGIDTAGIVEKILHQQLQVTADYQWLGLVKRELESIGAMNTEITYDQRVQITCYIRPDLLQTISTRLTDATAAQVNIIKGNFNYL